jgi:hypothetical protein
MRSPTPRSDASFEVDSDTPTPKRASTTSPKKAITADTTPAPTNQHTAARRQEAVKPATAPGASASSSPVKAHSSSKRFDEPAASTAAAAPARAEKAAVRHPHSGPVPPAGAPISTQTSFRYVAGASVAFEESYEDEAAAGPARATRILTAEQFKRLFQTDIAGLTTIARSPERAPQPSPSRPSTAARSDRRPGSAGGRGTRSVRNASATRRAVDPYMGTRFGPMMANQPPPSKTAVKLRRTVIHTATGDARYAPDSQQRSHSPPRHSNPDVPHGRGEDDSSMRLHDQINAMKLQLTLKDQRIHQLLRQKGQLEQETAHLSSVKFSRVTATGAAQPADEIIIGLKARISFLEEKLRLSDEDVQAARHSSKSLRVATIQEQAAVYLAEVQRLKGVLRDRDAQERSGGEGAALAEAHSVIASKDGQLIHALDKCRTLKDRLREALDEADRCKKVAAESREDALAQRKRIEELKEAPAEVLRLRVELRLAEERLGDATREIARISGDKDAVVSGIRTRDESLTAALRERDVLKVECEQLQLQLKAHEEASNARIAAAVQRAKKEADDKIQEANLFAKDRDATLRSDARELHERIKELEAQIVKMQAEHKETLEVEKIKAHQRHETIVRTMALNDQKMLEEQNRAFKEAERRFAAEREAFELEKRRYEADEQRRRKELQDFEDEKRRLQKEAEAARAAAASATAVHPVPLVRPIPQPSASMSQHSLSHHTQAASESFAHDRSTDDARKRQAPPPQPAALVQAQSSAVYPNSLGESLLDRDPAPPPIMRPTTATEATRTENSSRVEDVHSGAASATGSTLTKHLLPSGRERYRHGDEVSDATFVHTDHDRHGGHDEDTIRVSQTLDDAAREPSMGTVIHDDGPSPARPSAAPLRPEPLRAAAPEETRRSAAAAQPASPVVAASPIQQQPPPKPTPQPAPQKASPASSPVAPPLPQPQKVPPPSHATHGPPPTVASRAADGAATPGDLGRQHGSLHGGADPLPDFTATEKSETTFNVEGDGKDDDDDSTTESVTFGDEPAKPAPKATSAGPQHPAPKPAAPAPKPAESAPAPKPTAPASKPAAAVETDTDDASSTTTEDNDQFSVESD